MDTTAQSAALVPAAARRQVGQLVAGRYRIERELATGGMGVVFQVNDERESRKLALKQLRIDLPENAAVLGVQFEREYHTLSQLSHPCIIQVFDYGVDEGSAYYTMELLQGQDLRQRGKLPWREACAVLRDVASALAILHSRRLLHRDVTARNVFCTTSRSKLIDFGAMTVMGVAKHVVGTPPFVPPEALQQQALDGRADLYALGALAYFVLTGAYAYPARSFAELKQRFATPPPTLRQHDAEIPEALDLLVMALLQLERSARPASAAEVMERLSGIAGLPLHERAEVGKAYLVLPNLIGRDALVERLRVDLLSGRQGNGTSVLLEGPAGSGRSRALDACVMRAKLRGAVVLRADAADGARGPYGMMRALGAQLIEALPVEALNAARRQLELLGSVLPELAQHACSLPPHSPSERRHVQAALRDWFLATARGRHVVIAVDDVERCDEPSTAVLAALAHGAKRRRLNLLSTTLAGAPPSAALALLRAEAHVLTLEALTTAETELLLRSVFGDVPHVAALAQRIHALAAGNPSATMVLAEHLVDRAIARYEAGSWTLPEQLADDHLPSSASAALQARLEQLGPDARDLAEVLALTDPQALAPSLYIQLSDHGDSGRTFQALAALVAAGVLALSGDRYRFARFDLPARVERGLPAERARTLHARLARALEGTSGSSRVAHHLLHGGHEAAAIELIRKHSHLVGSRADVQLAQDALACAKRLSLPLHDQLELRVLILSGAAATGQRTVFLEHAGLPHEHLLRDSGLLEYAKLPANLGEDARMREALERTEARYRSTPPAERGFAQHELSVVLVRVYGAFASMAAICQELELIEGLPRLDPLIAHVPRLGAIQATLDISVDLQAGRTTAVLQRSVQLAAALATTDPGDPDPAYRHAMRLMQLYTQGLFAATSGRADARDRVAELEDIPGHRVNAWRVRMVYELMHGNMDAATECQRRAELLNLQDGGRMQFPGTTVRVELLAHTYADDILGVKRAAERIAELAAIYPGWQPTLAIARCHYKRLQGDGAGALAELEPAIALAQPGRHLDFWLAAYSHIRVLIDLDRAPEAAVLGEQYIATSERSQLSAIDYGLRQVTADALVRMGRTNDALLMIEQYIDMHQRAGTRGLRLGLAYETRARVAIAMRDEPSVQHYTRLCAQQYKGGRHLALLNRYARLLREADAGGIALTTGLRFGADLQASALHTQTAHTVQSRLFGCVGATERAEAGLRILLEASGAESGYLFGVRDKRLQQIAPGDDPAPPDLRAWLETYLRSELQSEVSTVIDSGMHDAAEAQRYRHASGREYEPLALTGRHDGASIVAGIAAVHYTTSKRTTLRHGVLEALTEILIADGIVEPMAH